MTTHPAPQIESDDLSLEALYKDFYVVPDFQREYVWQTENVERLLTDVYDEFFDEQGNLVAGPEYFIGSIVACRNADGRFQLIDGQQRMTTTYIALCAIRDRLNALGQSNSAVLDGQIYATSLDENGNDVPRYRLMLQYEDSHGVLEQVANPDRGPLEEIEPRTNSIKNILAAYITVREFLTVNFGNDIDKVRRFMAAFTKRVKLIRIITPSLTHALKVFETINDRGVGLNAMDLLKNLLFMRTQSADYPKLKEGWKDLVDTLDRCQEKPLRFLRYYVLSHYEVDSKNGLREDEIYDWFVRNAGLIGINANPLGFLNQVRERAKAYANFVDSRAPNGIPSRYLRNIALLSNKARQHFVLLLAGQHLPPDAFDRLCAHVENLFFTYIVTREPTKTFDRNFSRWSHSLRNSKSVQDVEEFVEKHITPDLRSRASAFDFAFREMRTSSIQQYRMRYILAKLTQFVDEAAWSNPASSSLDAYVGTTTHVEHILPQTPFPSFKADFDKPDEYDDYCQRLGNLCLLERTINTSIGNNPFATKKSALKHSNFLLTKSIAETLSIGTNTQFNKAVDGLGAYSDWSSTSIESRQETLGRLARRVWGIPSAT